MSDFYDDMIETALEMIEEFGQSVTWQQVSEDTKPDPVKPWISGDTITVDNTVDMVFLPVDSVAQKSIQMRTDSLVPAGTEVGYMGQTSFTPSIRDVVIRGGETITIKNIDVYSSSGEAVLYIVGLGR